MRLSGFQSTQRLLELASVLFTVVACVPWQPPVATGYEYLLHAARAEGWQHGTDIAATYGPLGFLGISQYHPDTVGLLIAVNAAVFVILAIRLIAVFRRLGCRGPGWRTTAVLLPIALQPVLAWTPLLYLPYLVAVLMFLDHLVGGWRLEWPAAVLYGTAFAGFLLIKSVNAPLILLVVIMSAGLDIARRSVPKVAVLFAAALVVFWIWAGQSARNVLPFIANSIEVAKGYKLGMAVGSAEIVPVAAAVLVAQAAIGWALTLAVWRRAGIRAAAGLAILLAAAFYSLFSHGFTRADPSHIVPCILTTISLWGFLGAIPDPRTNPGGRRSVTAVHWTGALLVVVLVVSLATVGAGPSLARAGRGPLDLYRLATTGTRRLALEARAHAESLRLQVTPALSGSVDVQGADPGIASASGASLRLRPTLASFGAYTERLARLNADFLEGARGPDAVLMGPSAIDNNYPTVTDGYSYLSLISHFQYAASPGDLRLFLRRPAPIGLHRVPLTSRTAALGERIMVPDARVQGIWAQVVVSPKPAGRLVSAILRPIPLQITVALDDGEVIRHRLPQLPAASGFLLSPYLGDPEALSRFYGARGSGPRARMVRSITVEQARLERLDIFYREKFLIHLVGLTWDPGMRGDSSRTVTATRSP